ncbi:MAG TPA: response regulator [Vicinamibacterales bacterium]|nr:response regulator [Vicinamibacterales bacterium]
MATDRRRLTVLLVEDDPAALTFYGEALVAAGYDVLPARNGTEALARAQAELPDAVIADLGLPDFDGLEVCRQLRLHPATRHLPAVALTGRSMALRDIEFAESAGFASVLLKPATIGQLSDAILRARRRANVVQES